MKIKIVGAAGGEVTGSAYFVQTDRVKVLVDAGMFQGGKKSERKNRLPAGVKVSQLDAVLLTHAHLDHSGRLPLLFKHGFGGPVFATAATIDLAELVMKDSARLQEQDAQRINRRREFAKEGPLQPLYRPEHVEPFRKLARAVPFREPVRVADGITARWLEAGHMLGSASIELSIDDRGKRRVLVFSGDLGPQARPIVRDFDTPERADVIFLESTYGNREHRPYSQTISEFESIVKAAARARSKVLIPTFAIGRAQQILYHLAIMFRKGTVSPFHVYLDSPMAIEASKIMVNHPDLFDEELAEWKDRGLLPLDKKWFHATVTPRQSQALHLAEGPCLILAGAGMCTGGRILHHFFENLHRERTHVLMVGYQAAGSLGRRLVEGAKSVSIRGERVDVRANVHTLGGFSAHAGQSDLLRWMSSMAGSKPRVMIIHGEDLPRKSLAMAIQKEYQLDSQLPKQGEVVELR